MARLPIPGKDNGTWGQILNDYLSQSHKSDGTLKDDSVGSAQLGDDVVTNSAIAPDAITATEIQDGSILEAQLDSGVQTKLNAAAPTWSTLSGKPAIIAAGSSAQNARTAIDAAEAPKDTSDNVLDVQPTLGWKSVMEFGAKPATVVTDASVSASSTTVTSPSGGFSSAMNGMKFYFHNAGPVLVSTAYAWDAHPLVGTFTYVSSTSGTLSTSASTTVSGGRLVIGEDTTTEFQAALDSGAERVHIPPNASFIVNELRLPTKTELSGSNRDTSRLYSTTPKANVIVANLTTDSAVRDLSIYGNGFGAQPPNTFPGEGVAPNLDDSGCGLVFAHCKRATASDVLVWFCGGDGVTTDRNGIAGIYLTFGCTDSNVTRCRTLYCRNGINEDAYFNSSSPTYQAYCTPTDNTYADNITSYCRFGIAIDSASLSRGASITNHVSNYNVIYGIDVHSSKYVTIISPRCSYNGVGYTAPGIQIYGDSTSVTCDHITIIGPMCFSNGTHGIKISEYTKDWKIIGGMCARNFRHGIYCNTQANDGFILGTSCRRNGQGSDSPGTYDGVRITSCERVHVLVNSFDDAADYSQTPMQNWGVRVDGSSDYITVDDASKFRGNLLGEVLLTGTNSRRGARTRAQILAEAQGLKGETFSRMIAAGGFTPNPGDQRATLVPFVAGDLVTNLHVQVLVAGSSTTLVKLGIWDSSGTLLGSTANISSTINGGIGVVSAALSSVVTISSTGGYYIGFVTVGGTSPTLLRGTAGINGYVAQAVGSALSPSLGNSSKTDIGSMALTGSGNAPWLGWS